MVSHIVLVDAALGVSVLFYAFTQTVRRITNIAGVTASLRTRELVDHVIPRQLVARRSTGELGADFFRFEVGLDLDLSVRPNGTDMFAAEIF